MGDVKEKSEARYFIYKSVNEIYASDNFNTLMKAPGVIFLSLGAQVEAAKNKKSESELQRIAKRENLELVIL